MVDLSSTPRQWKKVLYERQPFADNYTDPKRFLDQLDRSMLSSHVDFKTLALGSTGVVMQLTAVSLFLALHLLLIAPDSTITTSTLFLIDVVFLAVIYICHRIMAANHMNFKQIMQMACLFFVCLRIAAPALQTLTAPYSDDTIYALVITCSTIHLVFHDYSYLTERHESFADIISLSAALLTSVLLASRLHRIETVTAFFLLAVISFSLFPGTTKLIRRESLRLHIGLTIMLYVAATLLLRYVDSTLLIAYQLLVVIISFVCPLWMTWMLRSHKKPLRGPWDIAEVHENESYG